MGKIGPTIAFVKVTVEEWSIYWLSATMKKLTSIPPPPVVKKVFNYQSPDGAPKLPKIINFSYYVSYTLTKFRKLPPR
jgi:hypothetical protein